MTTVNDVPANPLIERLAASLEDRDEIQIPEWARFAKTGSHKEKPPQQDGWWYVRTAAILRKVYIKGPIGTQRLRSEYGGRTNRGAKPNRFQKGSGSVIRTALQQLEAVGLVETVEGQGRRMTPEGQSFVDNVAHDLVDDLEEEHPALSKY